MPNILAHRVLADGSRLLVTAWLEGRTASFWPADGAVTPSPDIRAVFAAMGVWQAGWAERLHEGAIRRDLEKRGIPPEIEAGWRAIRDDVRDARFYEEALRRNAGAALIREALLREVGGDRAVATCRATAQRAAALARGIVTVPQTLDPGDFANENVPLRPDGTVALLDFEYAAFAPVVQVFESVGDDWESQPPADQAEAALKTYVEAWNGAGAIPLPWTAFLAAHRRLRIHRKALDLSANLRDLDDARHGRPTPDYDAGASAQDAARALCDLLATVDGGP